MRRVRVGVIGVGWWASTYHLPALLQIPDADVVAVCDTDATRAQAVAARYGVPRAYAGHEAMLGEDMDAVIVATPHDAHFAPVRDALSRGLDVLVEKPMTVNPEEAWELVAIARRFDARLHVGYPFLYTRHAAELRGVLAEGRLGDVLLATGLFATAMQDLLSMPDDQRAAWEGDVVPRGGGTYSSPRHGGGQALSQATHCVSLLLWLTGLEPVTVAAMSNAAGLPVDLVDAIAIQCRGGALLSVATTGSVEEYADRVEEYRIFGSSGQAALDTARGQLSIGGKLSLPLDADELYPTTAPAQRLVDAALGRAPVHVTGELGARTVDVLAAALAAARSGTVERLPLRVGAAA